MHDFFLCLVLVLSGFLFLQFYFSWCRKIGFLLIWLSSGIGTYSLTGSYLAVGLILSSWILFPFWEMVYVLRQLRISKHRILTDARPPHDEFEELGDMTKELLALNFSIVDECRVRPINQEQYFRIFLHQDGHTIATVSYLMQGPLGFHFIAFSSIDRNNQVWSTWDYPLTYGLLLPDRLKVYRVTDAESVTELYQLHQNYLEINGILPEQLQTYQSDREQMRTLLQGLLDDQVQHNLDCGHLAYDAQAEEEGELCYSWKGTFYVARQVLRDLFL